ncbi:MAG: pmrA [Gammaproteobacteria bacterium]|nr:MAG: pmrA [Gammaproteobacteria bacterium]TND03945.1 MAG: pmrA [Gammaproteobacteria bacterium]
MMRILVAEDDELLGSGIQSSLSGSGYAVDWVKDGQSALNFLNAGPYDLVILDLGLPRKSGLQIMAQLRDAGQAVPVLILTARDTVADRVAGLDSGADDYMVKPFDLDELLARIRALLRRRAGRAAPLIRYGDIELDPASHLVTNRGQAVDMSPREFSLLLELLENQGRVMSRPALEEKLYSADDQVESNALEVHIHHLRKKLGNELIRTVRGVGYIVDKTA